LKSVLNSTLRDAKRLKLNGGAQLYILEVMTKFRKEILKREKVVKGKTKRAFQTKVPPFKE